jgi:hypothetical protein
MTTINTNLRTLNKKQIDALATEFLTIAALYLTGVTRLEWTPAEMRATLALALRDLQSPRAILFYDERGGLETAPLHLTRAWARRLVELAEGLELPGAVVGNALIHAARQQWGQAGGSLLVWRERGEVIIHVLAHLEVSK